MNRLTYIYQNQDALVEITVKISIKLVSTVIYHACRFWTSVHLAVAV